MTIGYGEVGVYDSIRYTLTFDEITNSVYFGPYSYGNNGVKYVVKLNDDTVEKIKQNKEILIILYKKMPDVIQRNGVKQFHENEVTVCTVMR